MDGRGGAYYGSRGASLNSQEDHAGFLSLAFPLGKRPSWRPSSPTNHLIVKAYTCFGLMQAPLQILWLRLSNGCASSSLSKRGLYVHYSQTVKSESG